MDLSALGPLAFVCGILFIGILLIASAMKIVPENQRLSVFRLGRYIGDMGPGMVLLLPFIDQGIKKEVQDQVKQAQDEKTIWGTIGKTMTAVHSAGQIELSGQIWQARSKEPIPPDSKVRVKNIILEVEAV
jgi:regulator of protease activity HflC (stomatin/prohibitin superfamily)